MGQRSDCFYLHSFDWLLSVFSNQTFLSSVWLFRFLNRFCLTRNSFFSCLPDCNREYYENLKYCPCREFCPNGCPCEGFNCDLIDISTSTEWSSSTHKTVTTETTTTLVTSGLLRVFNFNFSIFEPQ